MIRSSALRAIKRGAKRIQKPDPLLSAIASAWGVRASKQQTAVHRYILYLHQDHQIEDRPF